MQNKHFITLQKSSEVSYVYRHTDSKLAFVATIYHTISARKNICEATSFISISAHQSTRNYPQSEIFQAP